MPNLAPPPITTEGGGYVVTCQCRWLKFYESQKDAAEGRREHVKKCKQHKAVDE